MGTVHLAQGVGDGIFSMLRCFRHHDKTSSPKSRRYPQNARSDVFNVFAWTKYLSLFRFGVVLLSIFGVILDISGGDQLNRFEYEGDRLLTFMRSRLNSPSLTITVSTVWPLYGAVCINDSRTIRAPSYIEQGSIGGPGSYKRWTKDRNLWKSEREKWGKVEIHLKKFRVTKHVSWVQFQYAPKE